nr:unnamed protein product [Haemonchus contortus]
MLRLVLNALCFLGTAHICNASFSCNSTDNIHYSCYRDLILAIDATSDMLTSDNIRAEFDFIENWMLPQLDIEGGRMWIGMAAYGTRSNITYGFNSNRRQICSKVEDIWNSVDIDSASNVSLSTTISNLLNWYGLSYHTLVLFTGARDQDDVDAAGAQVEYYIENRLAINFYVVVVNYGNCSFSNWPQLRTIVHDANTIDADKLSNYVDESICGEKFPNNSYVLALQ